MCQAKIWIRVGSEEKEFCRDITELVVENEFIVLKSFFEPDRKIKGKIKEIDFLKGKVVIEGEKISE
jgi:predicted RNA-binding protein